MTSTTDDVDVRTATEAPVPQRHTLLFGLLTGASALSKLGNQFLLVAVPILLYDYTGSAVAAVLSAAAQNAPYLLSPILGPYVDRVSRRLLFVTSELVSAFSVAAIPTLLIYLHAPIITVYGLVFIVGVCSVLSSLANDFTFVPSLLGSSARDVERAYSIYSSTLDIARFIGPGAAGMMIVLVNPAGALWLDAATFLGTALVATKLWDDRAAGGPRESLFRSFARGWAKFVEIPTLRTLASVLGLFNLGVGAITTFLVAVGISDWHWSSAAIGWVLAIGSLGSAAGGWICPRVARQRQPTTRIALWLGLSAVSSLLMLAPWRIAVVVSFWLMSLAAGGLNVTTLTYRRNIIPDEYAGRLNAIMRALIAGAIPMSAVVLSIGSGHESVVKFLPVTLAACGAAVVWGLVARRLPSPETAM